MPESVQPTEPGQVTDTAAPEILVGKCPVCHGPATVNGDLIVGPHVYYDGDQPHGCPGTGLAVGDA